MHEGKHSNGTLTIGGVDSRLSEPVAYVPDSGFFFHAVKVASMTIGTKTVQIGQSGILDTGTNILLLPSSVYSEFQTTMCADSSLPHCKDFWQNKCFDLT